MKALDKKYYLIQVITGIIGDKISFIEAKENFLYEEETDRKTLSKKLQSLPEKKIQQIYQSQSEWNIERCIRDYKII